MRIYDKLALGRKARELDFTRDAFEKMCRLTEVLRYINSERELNPLLALKGGTAINLTMFSLPRLSVDIDLDFAENLARPEMLVERERINELLGRFAANEGYALKDKSKRTHALDSFVYSYTNAAGNNDNIKIEINYMLRCHALPIKEVIARTDGAFSDFSVLTLSPVEVFASKIVALSDRAAARDLYDLNNMVYYRLFGESEISMLRKCAILYLAVAGDASRGLTFQKLDSITVRDIRADLSPMIRNAERFDLQAARERVSTFLHERMALAERETAFLKHFAAGRYEPQLLFEDSEIIQRVEHHPMAAWRIQHIRQSQEAR